MLAEAETNYEFARPPPLTAKVRDIGRLFWYFISKSILGESTFIGQFPELISYRFIFIERVILLDIQEYFVDITMEVMISASRLLLKYFMGYHNSWM